MGVRLTARDTQQQSYMASTKQTHVTHIAEKHKQHHAKSSPLAVVKKMQKVNTSQ